MTDELDITARPGAAANPDVKLREPEGGLRDGADAPIDTTVRTVKLARPADPCPHGLPYIRIDGERWHHADGDPEYAFVECKRGKR